jgi:hypothetical protein
MSSGRKSGDLEEEIMKLKQQLSFYESHTGSHMPPRSNNAVEPQCDRSESTAAEIGLGEDIARTSVGPVSRILSTTVPGGMSPDSPGQSSLPGATTIPNGTVVPSGAPAQLLDTTSPRKLRDVELAKDEINNLFQV